MRQDTEENPIAKQHAEMPGTDDTVVIRREFPAADAGGLSAFLRFHLRELR